MIANFNKAIEFILRPDIEGKFSDDPDDPGGLTKWGIASKFFPQVNDPEFSKNDAIIIYRSEFWLPCRCDQLPNGIDLLVFDTAVNMGVREGIKLLQKILKVNVDGIIGVKTAQAIVNFNPRKNDFMEFLSHRGKEYGLRCVKNPKKLKYLRGWILRCFKVYDVVIGG